MKKTLSLLLAALLLFGLAACGGGKESSSQPVSSLPEASSTPSPVVEDALEVAFLTGLEKGPDYPAGQRITAVMVNNIAQSRPTRGLSDAKMVVEIVTEGGITRFMALYEDFNTMPVVGSIRSARDQFVQLLIPFWGFLVHDGESTVARQLLNDYDYDEFDLSPALSGSTISWWDNENRSGWLQEYKEYTSGEHIANTIKERGLDTKRQYNSPIFSFVPYTDPKRVPADGTSDEFTIVHSAGYRTLFSYDAASTQYKMSAYNSSNGNVEKTIDENNNEQLGFDNLLVLFAQMSLYPNSQLTNVSYYGGAGYYFSQGGYEKVLWKKGGPQEPLQVLKFDGSEVGVQLNPGTTYLAMVDDKTLEEFDANLLAGVGAENAMGVVNKNETETND